MNIDIRGIWRYKAARETCEGLRDASTAQAAAREAAIAAKDAVIEQKDREAELAKEKINQLQGALDEANEKVEKELRIFFREKGYLKKEHAKQIHHLQMQAEEQHRSYESLEEYCRILEDDAKKLKEKIKDLEAKNAELKKTRYRWVDHRHGWHGWWPVESGDLDDLVMKVPYVVYTMQKREQEGEEEQEEKRIPEV